MAYLPKFTDKRVFARIKHAYGFARAFVSTNAIVPSFLAKVLIDKHFGQQQHALSAWLRDHLLICVNEHYSMDNGKVKQYILNQEGAAYIRAILQGKAAAAPARPSLPRLCSSNLALFDREIAIEWVKREFKADLTTLDFEYNDKSKRLWHPLQNVNKSIRGEVLSDAGLEWDYDIEAAAPTLILQHAQRNGMDEYLFGLMDYLNNKDDFRAHVSRLGNIEGKEAKVLINALFCGARLGNNPDWALFWVLNGDRDAIRAIRGDARISALRADIKSCWDVIEVGLPKMMNEKGRKLALSSWRKWAVYYDLERLVMSVVREYLRETGRKFFLIHDGWVCSEKICVTELEELVQKKTGFSIKLKEERYS